MKPLRIVMFAAALCCFGLPASADLLSYMTIVGATQGAIIGDSTLAGREDQIPVMEYHHLIERLPGQPIQHETVIVTVEFDDRSLPNLMSAMATDESLTVTVDFYRAGTTGAEENYVTVTLTNAKVTSIEPLSARSDDPALVGFAATARVRLSYQSIAHEHKPTGATASL